ncbi:hypothetical protein FEZ18_05230 [Oceanihabitans sp. IOP_32]|uniref:hypothetical protein n=1 Tax=Oceanihabitans sp. IOP_32 TaxID=2529032 RepID=UPI001292D9A7|nr:hypothetical protein [Oceanihabitans sp. IOP_32]QFZ54235.1 hypothetical protein FEZ18_05230 [Oceanihabitans sp. IOP_32]
MKKTIIYILFVVLTLNLSCKTDKKTDLKTLDAQKTSELITQILNDERDGYLSSSCMTENPRAVSSPMISNFDEYVKKLLNIKDSLHYKTQSRLSKKFKITADLAPEKNILTKKQFDEFERKSEKGGFSFWDWLDANCENGYCSISKPIFNETFNLAYVRIGTVCGRLCGGGEERIYEFIDGKWIEKESLGSWVS